MNFFASNNIHLYIAVFLSVLNGGVLAFFSSKFLQVVQQAGYDMKGYYTWLRGTRYKYLSRLFTLGLLSIFCAVATNALLDVYHKDTMYSYFGILFYFYFSAVFIFNLVKEPAKVPLVRTKRIGRIFALLFLMYSVATFLLVAFSTEYLLLIRFGIITLTPIVVPFFVIAAFYMILPLEKLINKIYILRAKKKLEKLNIIKIGITGSYAKTSTKFILEAMLAQKYKVLASPHSYNTPLGLTRVILNNLTPEHQIFVAEMGAKKVGEITELCNLVQPNHGILTSVGTQHLETFKTQENVAKTKFELAQSIKDGFMVFNGDNALCKQLFDKYTNPNKLITFAQNKGDAYCSKIKANQKGLTFTLHVGNEQIECQTSLLGVHNLQNIAMCAALANSLGISMEQIKTAIGTLKPSEHRLQILPSQNGMIVIDDSFNASVEGCKAAIDTIALFKGHQKVVITPGIIEMGALETTANFDFGAYMASVCNKVIIVGDLNQKAIREGLLSENFEEQNIYCVSTLDQAKQILQTFENNKTVVLFENDLPDLFVY